MNKELVRQWLEALRSLEYPHGTDTLRSIDNRFCPLGVLCDISKDALGLEWQAGVLNYCIGGTSSIVPNNVINYLGLDCNNALINITNSKIPLEIQDELSSVGLYTQVSIIRLNDDYYLTNYQIADILEEEFLSSGTINEDKTVDVA